MIIIYTKDLLCVLFNELSIKDKRLAIAHNLKEEPVVHVLFLDF